METDLRCGVGNGRFPGLRTDRTGQPPQATARERLPCGNDPSHCRSTDYVGVDGWRDCFPFAPALQPLESAHGFVILAFDSSLVT